ncbi:MAG: hypothetical protein ACT4O2_13175 [Beijerinckiaceae bacterium]
MVFPKFAGMLGRKRDYWRPRPLATILLDRKAKFIHTHQWLNNRKRAGVNLDMKSKPVYLRFRSFPSHLG